MTEVISPFFDLDENNVVDNSITEFEYLEYLPRDSNNMNKASQHIIETRDEDVYLLPHKAFLEVRGRLQTAANNANYAANDAISLVNNGWSLFQSAQYQLSNKTVEDVNDYLPYASTILNLIMFSDDYSRSTASNMLWIRDTLTGQPTLKQNLVAVANDANAAVTRDGFNAAIAAYNTNQTANLFLPLSQIFGFCKDITNVFRGVKHSLLLDRAVRTK